MTHDRPPSITALGSSCAFFLDVDGTLLELATHPREVILKPGLIESLHALQTAAGGALALISGREIADLDRLFRPLQLPAAGQHGLERRDAAGKMHSHAPANGAFDRLRGELREFTGAHSGILVEDKGASIAVHYRRAPPAEPALESLLVRFCNSMRADYRLQRGKMVFEVMPAGRDKGTAIKEYMREQPFRDRTPVFIGDDVTDEDGFCCVNELNGFSIKVGPGSTCAHWRLHGAESVLEWLRDYTARRPEA